MEALPMMTAIQNFYATRTKICPTFFFGEVTSPSITGKSWLVLQPRKKGGQQLGQGGSIHDN